MKLSTTFLILAVALTGAISAPHRLQARGYDYEALEVRHGPSENHGGAASNIPGQIHHSPHDLQHPEYHTEQHQDMLAKQATVDGRHSDAAKHLRLSHEFAADKAYKNGDTATGHTRMAQAYDLSSEEAARVGDRYTEKDHAAKAHTLRAHLAVLAGNFQDAKRHFNNAAYAHKAVARIHRRNGRSKEVAVRMSTFYDSRHDAAQAEGDQVAMATNKMAAYTSTAEAHKLAGEIDKMQESEGLAQNEKMKLEMFKGQTKGLNVDIHKFAGQGDQENKDLIREMLKAQGEDRRRATRLSQAGGSNAHTLPQ